VFACYRTGAAGRGRDLDFGVHLCRGFQAELLWLRRRDRAGRRQAFRGLPRAEFVTPIQVDSDVGRAARRLLREFPVIAKPQDAVHLASTLLQNVHTFHTFDRENLLGLDGKLNCLDKEPLRVLEPPQPPDPDVGTLFEGIVREPPAKKAG
jgi:predicted nucleic acid-binding protein